MDFEAYKRNILMELASHHTNPFGVINKLKNDLANQEKYNKVFYLENELKTLTKHVNTDRRDNLIYDLRGLVNDLIFRDIEQFISEFENPETEEKEEKETDSDNPIHKARYLISIDHVEQAFLLLKKYFAEDLKTLNQLLLLNSRWSKNENLIKKMIIDDQSYRIENNQIINSILELLE